MIWSTMMGLLWIVVDYINNLLIGEKQTCSQEDQIAGIPTKDVGENSNKKPSKTRKKPQIKLSKPLEPLVHVPYQHLTKEDTGIDPYLNYLLACRSNFLEKRMLGSTRKIHVKHSISRYPREHRVLQVPFAQEVFNKSFDTKPIFKNDAVLVQKVTVFHEINTFKEYFGSVKTKVLDQNIGLTANKYSRELQTQQMCLSLVLYKQKTETQSIAENFSKNKIQLSEDQIIMLQKIAQYMVHFFKTNYVNKLPKSTKDAIVTQVLKDAEDCDFLSKTLKRNVITLELHMLDTSSKTTITELEFTEDSAAPRKKKNIWNCNEEFSKPTKFICKKKYRKRKISSSVSEHKETVYPVNPCLGMLIYFMDVKQGYTMSKVTMQIKRELKPIKDQINELRDSMTNFSSIHHEYNRNGGKSCTNFLHRLEENRSKCIFTVLPRCTDPPGLIRSSPNLQQNCLPKTDPGRKKLSPLAEMYIKLSQN